MAKDSVQLEGAEEFTSDLGKTIKGYPRSLREAETAVARSLASRARIRGQALGGVERKASPSIRARANAVVAGAGIPYFMGAEYGGIRYRQFATWRGNSWRGWAGSPGQMVGASVRRDSQALMDAFTSRLDDAHSVAFPD